MVFNRSSRLLDTDFMTLDRLGWKEYVYFLQLNDKATYFRSTVLAVVAVH